MKAIVIGLLLAMGIGLGTVFTVSNATNAQPNVSNLRCGPFTC